MLVSYVLQQNIKKPPKPLKPDVTHLLIQLFIAFSQMVVLLPHSAVSFRGFIYFIYSGHFLF